MNHVDPHRIASVEQLRALIGEPSPLVSHKLWKTLEPAAVEFIRRSPFLLLATADAAGNQDVRQKETGRGLSLLRMIRPCSFLIGKAISSSLGCKIS